MKPRDALSLELSLILSFPHRYFSSCYSSETLSAPAGYLGFIVDSSGIELERREGLLASMATEIGPSLARPVEGLPRFHGFSTVNVSEP